MGIAKFEHPFLRQFRRLGGCIIYEKAKSKRSYTGWSRMQGDRAVYVSDIEDPIGYIWFNGEVWKAEARPHITDPEDTAWYLLAPVDLAPIVELTPVDLAQSA